jgi:hypothetical protein
MSLNNLVLKFAQTLEDPNNKIEIPRPTLDKLAVQHGLQLFFGIAGGVALVIIAISALKYTISRGDANAIKGSKEAIIYALIGLVVCMSGYSFVTFVLTNL